MVTAVHELAPAVDLNVVPAMHEVHWASALLVAAWKPLPAGHDETVIAEQDWTLKLALKVVPVTQAVQAESAVAVPATKPWPAGQGALLCAVHTAASL